MKRTKTILVITATFLMAITSPINGQDAKSIIKKADEKMQGEESSYTIMTMKIIRPTWDRTITFESWTKGRDNSLALITSPPKEKGQTFLKRENEMWNWNPTINRLIKLPPSMMSQGWMGSDFSNDDLLKESSIVVDYTHKIIGDEVIDDWDCYIIELTPLEDAAVVWGKIVKWISKEEYLQMKTEYYDEDNYLIKTELAYDVQTMGGRLIPTTFELIPEDEEGNKTVVTMDKVTFNEPISDGFFSQQNMKKVR
ncbi:MAG: outer membrane lipoprotein-sorting protein [Bacteroidales bacterium]|nr:outer membrane lipoprotein-sorting protein [Bacteroidales bacterium]